MDLPPAAAKRTKFPMSANRVSASKVNAMATASDCTREDKGVPDCEG